MLRQSACIEMLFAEPDDLFSDRIGRAAAAGFDAVEFWRWTNKDIDLIGAKLAASGMSLAGMVAEPMIWLTDPANHSAFLEGLKKSVDVARQLGAPILIAQAGNLRRDETRVAQHQAIADCLMQAVPILAGSGVVVALEPLNDRVDHPGYFLTSTVEGLDIVDAVGAPEVRLLYDIYHSAVMGEKIEQVLKGRVDRVAHVHLADVPGRHEPGSGSLDWQFRLKWLEEQGYSGRLGLEYSPSSPSHQAGPGLIFPQAAGR